MKPNKQNSLGFDLTILLYESYDEADKAAGKPLAALAECNKNLAYRGAMNDGRSIITDAVEKITGVKREYDPVMKTEKGNDGVERQVQAKNSDGEERWTPKLKDGDFVDVAIAKAIKEGGREEKELRAAIQAEIDRACSTYEYKNDKGEVFAKGLQVDIKETPRKATAPKVLAQKYIDRANGILASKKVAKFATDFKKIVGRDLAAEEQADATKLGWAVKEFSAALEASATAAYEK